MKNSLFLLIMVGLFVNVTCSFSQEADTVKKYRKYDLLPALSYAPETGLTLGVIGYRYLRLGKKYPYPETKQSAIDFVAVYTTRNQILIESNYDIFTDANKYRIRGFFGYDLYPDRNYGLGNNADALVRDYKLKNGVVTDSTDLNYLDFSIIRLTFKPAIMRKVKDKIYAGLRFDIEYGYNLKYKQDSFAIINGASGLQLLQNSNKGLRSGVGLALVYDSRDNILNPRTGSFIDYSTIFYGKFIGSKYAYTFTRLDARKYFNPVKNHTIALRGNLIFSSTKDPTVPIRGMARVGGNDFMRGYFRGTYQDRNLASFEAEYRWPFWNDDVSAPLYKIWKRLGMVAFISGAQVFGDTGDFSFHKFNYAAGTGLRILFNPQSRVNIRIDYAWGLSDNSAGIGKKQTGLYFFLSEVF